MPFDFGLKPCFGFANMSVLEQGSIIRDLTIVVMCAAAVTVVFNRLRLPVILGYLLSGVLLGPHLPGLPTVSAGSSIKELSQLGIVFLMFFIGMEFDLKRLQKVFWPAFIAAVLQSIIAFFIGTLSAPLLGYTTLEGIFLGGILTNSASMLCIKLLKDQGRLKQADAHMAVGILIFEDIIAIMLLVILSGVSVSHHFNIDAVYEVTFLLGVFVVGVYFLGRLLAPALSRLLKRANSPEIITLVTVALVLGVGELAQISKFSISLGAFLAGAIMANTQAVNEIQRITEPFRDLFCAVFFVTIGMLIDPRWLVENAALVIFIAMLVVAGKLLTCWLGLFVGGQSAETGFRASLSKASVGEFGFIIAALWQASNPDGANLASMTVGLALVTYLALPVLNYNPGRTFQWLADKTPEKVKAAGRIYEKMLDAIGRRVGRITFFKLARRPLLQITFYFILLNGLLILAYIGTRYFDSLPSLDDYQTWVHVGVWLVGAALCLPFLSAIIRNLDVLIHLVTGTVFQSSRNPQLLSGRMANLFHTLMLSLVIILFGGLYLTAASPFFPQGVTLGLFIVAGCVALVIFWKSIININSRMEYLFMQSFQQQTEENEEQLRQATLRELAHKHAWDMEVESVMITADSIACGKLLHELRLREKTGASIVAIGRGANTHYDPSPEVPVFAGDSITLMGSQKQLNNASRTLQTKAPTAAHETQEFVVDKLFVRQGSFIEGQTMAGSNLRRDYHVSVLGIQRGKRRIAPPPVDEIIHVGDVLLVVGTREAISRLEEQMRPLVEPLGPEPEPEADGDEQLFLSEVDQSADEPEPKDEDAPSSDEPEKDK